MPKKLSASDLEKYESMLRQMLAVVSGDIENLETETRGASEGGKGTSLEDAGSEVAALELSLELLGRDENTSREILEALDRIQAGTFGVCETCDKGIKKTRLSAMPIARNCIECQREAEAQSW